MLQLTCDVGFSSNKKHKTKFLSSLRGGVHILSRRTVSIQQKSSLSSSLKMHSIVSNTAHIHARERASERAECQTKKIFSQFSSLSLSNTHFRHKCHEVFMNENYFCSNQTKYLFLIWKIRLTFYELFIILAHENFFFKIFSSFLINNDEKKKENIWNWNFIYGLFSAAAGVVHSMKGDASDLVVDAREDKI